MGHISNPLNRDVNKRAGCAGNRSSACSSSCSCPSTWYKKNSPDGAICYKRFVTAKKYTKAKEHCESLEAEFPRIRDADDLAWYTKQSGLKNWFQAERRGGSRNGEIGKEKLSLMLCGTI